MHNIPVKFTFIFNMESQTAVNSVLNSLQSTEIETKEIEGHTVAEICPPCFQVGDKFSSVEEVLKALKNFESKSGLKYFIQDSRKIQSLSDHPDFSVNQALKYSRLKYCCVQGGKYILRQKVVYVRQSRTLKNGCPAHIYFCLTHDKRFLEVRRICDVHNHEISEINAKRRVCDLYAERGMEMPMKKPNNSSSNDHGQTQRTECQEASVESNCNEPVSDGANDKMDSMKGRADKAVEDLVREKKRSNDLKEQLLEESIKRNNCLDALLRTNSLDNELLEESRTRNKYLEALIKINCLRYNQSFEVLMNEEEQD